MNDVAKYQKQKISFLEYFDTILYHHCQFTINLNKVYNENSCIKKLNESNYLNNLKQRNIQYVELIN